MHAATEPGYWWDAVESRFGDRRLSLMLLVLAFSGAFGIALACEIGVRYFNTDWHYVLGYSVQRGRDWKPFFALWAGVAIAPMMQGLVGVALLKIYSRPLCWRRGLAVAIIGSIPMYVTGLTLFLLPGILLFAVAFLISCGWWASGNRRLLGIRDSESAEHLAVSLTISGALMMLGFASLPL
ncbi:MAG TPA: hypothetical protein VJU53_15580 [Burkholderiaceae bacterium]|nr:hypothetical protein [Burkholderiaceae bacterium]